MREFDLYRRIPKDLTETTTAGTVLSVCGAIFMLVLFIAELLAFLSTQAVSNIVIDPNSEPLLRINFNITTYDLPCEYATIDIVDILGTRNENVTKNIHKWQISKDGIRKNYEGRNVEQQDINHDIHHDLATLESNGIHALSLAENDFEGYLKDHTYTFVNFYAPWCIWCQRLEPVWEAFAESVENEKLPVSIVKVDCVAHATLCGQQKIQAFPTLRWFKSGIPNPPDYRSDRTVEAFTTYIKDKLSIDHQLEQLPPEEKAAHHERMKDNANDHPGCMMTGFVLVNRVPGNFHIEARSKLHNLNPILANISHVVNHLSFGSVLSKHATRQLSKLPKEYFSIESTNPMNDNEYTTFKLHQAYHHYIKVVATNLELGRRYKGKNAILAYQMVQSSQVMQYLEDEIPEARFSYDISPMAVRIEMKGKKWYEFVTSICALIGGSFTVFGLLSGFLNTIFKAKKI